ncbi:MAG: trypsin-like peptidase domain-containing protein [Gemmatimonadota bacterium]
MNRSAGELWLVVDEGAAMGASMRLGTTPVLVGRDPEAQFRMDPNLDRLVSARHARLDPEGNGWVLTDLGSRNGTFVNGERVEGARRVNPEDRIQLGRGGPTLRITPDRPELSDTLPDARYTPRTREAFKPPKPRRPWLIGGGVGLAAVVALLGLWAVTRGSPDVGAAAGDGPPGADPGRSEETAAGATAPAPAPTDDPQSDTASARQAAEIAALRERIEGMDEQLREALDESERLRGALDDARREGASSEEVADLQRQLQEANASLRRQQLAASVDYDHIARIARPATALVYVEFEGGLVEAATAFGIDPRGRLLTNRHVVRRDENEGRAVLRIGVQYADRTEVLQARVVAISRTDDLALIEVTEPEGELPSVSEFNSAPDTLASGTPVVLFGFPLGGSGDTRGPARPLVSSGVLMGQRGQYIEIQGYARGGASGSPILDTDGQVIGVLAGGRTGEDGERLYAIPAPQVLRFLETRASGSS